MQLHTAIVPPRHVLEEVVTAVRAAGDAGLAPEAPDEASVDEPAGSRTPGRTRWMRRRARAGEVADPVAAPPLPSMLDLVPADAMSIPVAGFGQVTAGDAGRLTAALRRVAAETPRPTLRLAGAAALEFEGDRNVWVRVTGDLDLLKSATYQLTSVVEQLGFYVDRRKFRPMLAVAAVTDTTTADYLQGVLDALDRFVGCAWELDHVQLMRLTYGVGAEARELDRLPLLD